MEVGGWGEEGRGGGERKDWMSGGGGVYVGWGFSFCVF